MFTIQQHTHQSVQHSYHSIWSLGSLYNIFFSLFVSIGLFVLRQCDFHIHLLIICMPLYLQGLLRSLHSMHSSKSTILSQSSFLQSPTNSNEAYPLKEQNVSEGLPKALKSNEKYRSKEAVTKLSERIEACFWCFRGINLKIGTTKFVITSGKIMLGCLILFIYYVFRKKQATLNRYSSSQLHSRMYLKYLFSVSSQL